MNHYIGKPINRVDGPLKVRGEAKYAAEFTANDLAYGVVVSSEITKGKITKIETEQALRVPGVLSVLTYKNRPSISWFNKKYGDDDAPPGDHFRPLYDEKIMYSGQPIALVIGETFEVARAAAQLVHVEYAQETQETDLLANKTSARPPKAAKMGFEKPKPRGNAKKALEESEVRIDAAYSSPTEHHNPMEMHASTVIYEEDGKLTIYDKTQGVQNSQAFVCNIFGLKPENVRVLSPYVGGAFGSGLRPQYQLVLAVMGAQALERSVRVVLTRQQMFSFGHRPHTHQQLAIGASKDGVINAISHSAYAETSQFEDYTEIVVNWSGLAYKCDNVDLDYKLVPLDVYTPLDMRAPGAVLGVYALESAMDELAVALDMDPVELRLKNYAANDQNHFHRPYSSKELKACYAQGAAKFGWSKRNPKPRSMKEGHKLIGWGMATGIWDAMQQKTAAKAKIDFDGHLTVSSASSDIGTGTYTIMSQIAAETMGVSIESVTAELGDSSLPTSPLEGGSWTAASLGAAVQSACKKLRETLFALAKKMDDSIFEKVKPEEVTFKDGAIWGSDGRSVSYEDILHEAGRADVEEMITESPSHLKQMPYGRNTHSAVFVEVKVDEDLGMVEVSRVVSAIAAGRILNPKTARSQILGGVVWGAGMALHEESLLDTEIGRFMNHSFAEYHIPVAADIGQIDVLFVDEEDSIVSPMGVKGLGEIGIVGTAAAIANAVYHATGKRVRDLPITPEKLI